MFNLRELFIGSASRNNDNIGCAHSQESCCNTPVRELTELFSGEKYYKCVSCGARQ
jgi:hypothetical protein